MLIAKDVGRRAREMEKLALTFSLLILCSMAYSPSMSAGENSLGESVQQSSSLKAVLTLLILNQRIFDDDEDGIEDDMDQCPNTPAGEVVGEAGCSSSQLDADEDGVADNVDICPATPPQQSVNENGCSQSELDSDADGVTDDTDACPGTPLGQAVDGEGCAESQLDDDLDGVTNDVDSCPDTPPLVEVDGNGCAAFQLVRLVYEVDVNPLIVSAQAGCTSSGCHGRSGAPGGLRLYPAVALGNTQLNFDSFVSYIGRNGSARLLSKISGIAHSGGVRFAAGSNEYLVIELWAQSVEALP